MKECMKAIRIAEDNVAGLEGKQLGKVHLKKKMEAMYYRIMPMSICLAQ